MRSESLVRNDDTIVALATPAGTSALAVIRTSGPHAIALTNQVFRGADLNSVDSHTVHYGHMASGERIIDEVMVSVFRAPRSYTKENSTEISCHGSPFIVQEIVKAFLEQGARLANPGEFTKRAFLHGRFDLTQAEAVADLIHADSEKQRMAAMNQLKGGFSKEIKALREELVHFASMVELELDFSEEDVEFASRDDLKQLVERIQGTLKPMIESFSVGNAIKEGIPTVIAGKPNAGKSTLLNALLKEERAIVSDIPGTTRDVIEDLMVIDGIHFRFIDTAGIRETQDTIEAMGVERTQERMNKASLILYLFDLTDETTESIMTQMEDLEKRNVPYLAIGNKIDRVDEADFEASGLVLISAKQESSVEELKKKILETINLEKFRTGDSLVTNLRHYEALRKTNDALSDVITGIDQEVSNDLLALDIRNALHALGEITGEITTDDLLENIFSRFCIGK